MVENQDVNGPVPQAAGMNLTPGRPAHRPVHFIHEIEKLFLFHGKNISWFGPMPKIDVSKVAEILKKNQLEPALLRRLIEELNLAVQPDGADEEKPPAVKKQFVIMVSDPEGRWPKHDFAGWVLQIPESESAATTEERIFRTAYDYNTTKKGRLYPAKTVGEALENIPAKFFKETEVWVKSKTPVLVLKTGNDIPKE
jgi:hypothetical protein